MKLNVISKFVGMLEEAYQDIKTADLSHEDLSLAKELTSRCLDDEAFRFYKDIFNIETNETESDSDDADDVTDIKDEQDDRRDHETDEVAESSEEDKYRSIGKNIANRKIISDKVFKIIDDVIANTATATEALVVLNEKGVEVSYATICRRRQGMLNKDNVNSCKAYIIKAENAFNEMKAAGCKEYNGNIYNADGTPIPVVFTTNFVKFVVWNGIRIPTKYIVAMYHGCKVDKNTAIWHLNEDQRDTRIDNLAISTNDLSRSHNKKMRSKVVIDNICKIFAEEKGDPLKIWQRCVDDLGDFVTSTLLSNIRTKKTFKTISDKYFTVSDVKQWYKEEKYLKALDLTPTDTYTGDNIKYTEMIEKYAFTNKEIPLQDKEFILKNFLEQEYGKDGLLFTDETDFKYAIGSIRNKLKDKGINISTSYIRGIININGGGLKLGG